MRNFFLFLMVFIPLLISGPAVNAQQCDTPFEVIVTPRPPTFGFPSVWDAKYGLDEKMVQFFTGLPTDDGTVISMGRTLSKDDMTPQDIVFVELNRRSRVMSYAEHAAKPAERPVKMVRQGDRYVLLSSIRSADGSHKQARLSWYDKEGDYKRDVVFKDTRYDYTGRHLLKTANDGAYLVVVHAVNRDEPQDEISVVYKIGENGSTLWRRAYRPGIPNMMNALIPIDDESYLALGRIKLEDGRMAGWAMRLGYDGAVQWQRTYPRGDGAIFRDAAVLRDGNEDVAGFALIGDSMPLDDGPDAAWLMVIEPLGEPQWQRYIRRPHHAMSGNWVMISDDRRDGRVTMIMNAQAQDEEDERRDHIRMITMSPRGAIIKDEAYYEGLQATGYDFVKGPKEERIVIATIEDDVALRQEQDNIRIIGLLSDEENETDPDDKQAVSESDPVLEGWVLVATALDPYEDPCASPAR